MASVTIRQIGYSQRPRNTQTRIGGPNAAFRRRSVKGSMQIEQFAGCFQNLKAVRAAFRYSHCPAIVGCQLFRMPLQESSGTGAQIDGDIPHTPFETGYQFHFSMRRPLVVETSNRTHTVSTGPIDLHDMSRTENTGEF